MGLFQILGFLATPLGYVMEFLYNLVQNYGIALIIFTLLTRIVLFPLTLRQQKSTARNAAYQPMIQEIQKKWANDKQKQQQEIMKFQEENGIKMSAGCLPMVLNMVVLFSVIEVIYRPLKYILHIDAELITKATELLQNLDIGTISDYTAQSQIIGQVMAGNQELITLLGDSAASIQAFNFNFLGLNLSRVPTFSWETIPYLLLPALSIITMFLSQFIVMKTSGSQAGAGKSMLIMTVVMGVWFGFYAFTVPVAFSLYYTVSNILSLVQQLISRRIYNPEEYKKQILEEMEERKKAKKAKKVIAVKDETGNVVEKQLSDDEIARLRLAKARELDAQMYLESEEEKKKAEEALQKAHEVDENKYDKNSKKTSEKSDDKSNEISDAEIAVPESVELDGEEEVTIPQAPEIPAAPEMPKQEYKPGRRKRASMSKDKQTEEGPSFADKEKAEEDKA